MDGEWDIPFSYSIPTPEFRHVLTDAVVAMHQQQFQSMEQEIEMSKRFSFHERRGVVREW